MESKLQSAIDSIVNVQISIESPAATGENFDQLLIVGNAPAAPKETPDVGVYASLSEVAAVGWTQGEPVYDAAAVAFSQESAPNAITIAVRKVVEESPEELEATLDRAAGYNSWYGMALAGGDDTDIKNASKWAEANSKLFAFSIKEKTNPVKDAMRSVAIFRGEKEDYSHVAWLAICFNYEPGSETWAYKTLKGISPVSLNSTEKKGLSDQYINFYHTVAGKNITDNGKTCGGEWIDVIRFRDWLVSQIQTAVFSILVKNKKIPFTDKGLVLIENQIASVLKTGQDMGGIAETTWQDDLEVPGYSVTVPRASSISASDKANRILRGITFTATLSGAIHVIEIKGSLVN